MWGYEGDKSPEKWGDLDPSFILCRLGKEQSPIAIESSCIKEDSSKNSISLHYKESKISLYDKGTNLDYLVKSNGEEENYLLIDNHKYFLIGFHFHTPSEHFIDKKQYDLELHLVHRSNEGYLCVVGVMFSYQGDNARSNPSWIRDLWEKSSENISKDANNPTFIGLYDLTEFLPERKDIFYYQGSLTTPPCSEEVKWFLFTKEQEIDSMDLELFQKHYNNNNRPLQELGDRVIIRKSFQ